MGQKFWPELEFKNIFQSQVHKITDLDTLLSRERPPLMEYVYQM